MKKPRDLDAELQALQQRAKALKGRRVTQFGELVGAGFFQGQARAAPKPANGGERRAPDGGGASPS